MIFLFPFCQYTSFFVYEVGYSENIFKWAMRLHSFLPAFWSTRCLLSVYGVIINILIPSDFDLVAI